jgi:hypothetical protein
MNMKRGLVFSLGALALAVCSSAVHAQAPTVDVSLNLRYTDPADPSEGGTWYLVAKTNSANGLAAVNAYIDNINSAGAVRGTNGVAANGYPAVSAATIGALSPFVGVFGGNENVLYGQDTALGFEGTQATPGPIILNVGRGAGTPGNVAVDPLRNPAWNNVAVLLSGTFTGGGTAANGFNRPVFVTSGANVTDANTLANASATPPNNFAVDATTSTPVVRGDSVFTFGLNSNPAAGLRPGDINRDGTVNIGDFAILQNNFNGTNKTWDLGDVNDDNNANIGDFAVIQNNFNQSAPAPISAVPEPASLALAGLSAVCGLMLARRRSNS